MKIQHLLSGMKFILTNEEKEFVNKHEQVRISALNGREHWLAQNLVRKGIYEISKDNNTLIKK